MEKITIKEISPYLPYGLKMAIDSEWCKIETDNWRLESNDEDGLPFSFLNDGSWYHRTLKSVKPILRPLSDLTKKVEHNGEMFIPVDIICPKEDYKNNLDRKVAITSLELSGALNFAYSPYCIVQKLLEWHFDVFGLIEKGLAIDINTLSK